MLAVITLFAMLMVEDADADQAVNHTGNTQLPDAYSGRIEQDTTWRDTVYVIGDVTIASGATLTLAPDTKVHFMPYRDDTQGGLDSTRTELIVEGRLHAQAGGIVFCSAAATALGADWYGIVVKRGGLADVSNATIRDGLRCLYAERGGRVRMDHIAFANCGKPTQAEPEVAHSDSLSEQMEAMVKRYYKKADNRDAPRISKKLAVGVLGGVAGGLVGAAIARNLERRSRSEPEPSTDPSSGYALGSLIATIKGFCIGSMFGAVIGVSLVDRQDNLRITLGHSLAGSVVGLLGGIGLTAASKGTLWPSLFVGPVAMATAWSERSRKPPESRRVSVGLMSEPYGLSAIATLRF